MKDFKVVGKKVRRVDALGKVTGQARYAADLADPHMLYGAVLRASLSHARVVSIDVSQAVSFPGVEAVLTAADVPGRNRFGTMIPNQRVLADDKVRFRGDGLAVVAARSAREAARALSGIRVQLEPLSAVFSPEEAMKRGAPGIHGKSNIFVHHKVRKGRIADGFRRADVILRRTYTTALIEHAYLEPEAVMARPDGEGGVLVEGCVQNMYTTRRGLSTVLRLPLAKIRVVQTTVGGSFGGKDEVMTVLAARAAMLALRTGRPVQMVNSREESFHESYKRHPYVMEYRIGAKKNGRLTALEVRMVANAGAYATTTPFVVWRSVVQCAGPYVVPHVKADAYGVYTNTVYTGAMRGFGSPQGNFGIELLMDELAGELGMDPLDLRILNGIRTGSRTATGQKLDQPVAFIETLERSARSINWKRRREELDGQPRNARRRKGIGMAASYRGCALGAEGTDAAGAVVSVQTDGSVIVWSGIAEVGQGYYTVIAQITAEVLGVNLADVTVLPYDTAIMSDSGPSVASRSTMLGGTATRRAAGRVRRKMLAEARLILRTKAKSMDLERGWVVSSGGQRRMRIRDLAAACFERGVALFEFGWYKGPDIHWDEQRGRGSPYFTYVYGTNMAEVEVDQETGEVRVLQFVSAHDVGRVVNPQGVLGQIYGGVAMGLGYGLLEEVEEREGRLVTENFDEYLIPTSLDMPQMKAVMVENPDRHGPYGAKSVGEPTTEIAAPAVVNAICHATGQRVRDLPANLERVLLGKKLVRT
ncbi:MAG: xanthine dehydrogenase family protein [Candidatus Eisenbacteria sp.]|nr:xanthine dehydrogenase family protein [Candidatus Eisenbacteria bacterium]